MDQIKRIIIEGEKVHNVGYRPFLLWRVRELGIPNHDARNVKENGMQRVMVSVGGEEKQIREFVEFVKENYPENAKVSGVREVEPPERVMSVDEYDKVLAAEQQNTVVQAGLAMLDKQDKMLDKQDKTIEVLGGKIDGVGMKVDGVGNKVDTLREETKQDFTALRDDYGKISQTMESINQNIEKLTKAILKLAEKSAG